MCCMMKQFYWETQLYTVITIITTHASLLNFSTHSVPSPRSPYAFQFRTFILQVYYLVYERVWKLLINTFNNESKCMAISPLRDN